MCCPWRHEREMYYLHKLSILNKWMVDLLYVIPCALYVIVILIIFAAFLDEKRKFSPSTFVDLFPYGTVVGCRIYRGRSGGVTQPASQDRPLQENLHGGTFCHALRSTLVDPTARDSPIREQIYEC